MAMKYLAVDCGKADTKVCLRNEDGSITKKLIPTTLAEASGMEDLQRETESGIREVVFEGRAYVIGAPANGMIRDNSKKNIVHKVLTLSMIAEAVPEGSYVRAAIGCPLQCYASKAERKEYLDYILPAGKTEIEVNGRKKRFFVDRRAVFAEAYGPLLLFPERFMNRTVGVIDIGGFNVNGCYFLNGRLISEANITNQMGKYRLMSALVQPLNRLAPTADFHIYEIEEALRLGYVINAEEASGKILEEKKRKHLDQIVEACRKAGWNLDFCDLIFCGGTSPLLEKQIKERFPRAFIPEESNFINASGYLKMLMKVAG
ncbi:MAG: ParM/StbA family protein [Lachnospiraceae bacterium]|nr:ParM/StbA family protein [Lachnospiraceae bacterium]